MLPIRFIAESFGLDVSWNEYSKTVTVKNRIEKGADDLILPDSIPPYSGAPYIELNGGKPFFSSFDYVEGDFEEYSELDSLNRCGVAFANISTETMPTEKRGSIGMIKPSGWHTVRYEGIDQDYLYNRCHLIGYQLTGENDNDKNLITGTRYMNTEGMLPFENKVAEYVRNTGNHVLYRSTPIFEGENLLAN
ncbi:MAG: DNA/RNA non-specific endonuclease, partial [Clostridia bacterium]|nr:DNA/RNA non-specific endonuclease [Clostridia bacterium]